MNTTKTLLLMAALTALFMIAGQAMGGQQGMTIALLLALGLRLVGHQTRVAGNGRWRSCWLLGGTFEGLVDLLLGEALALQESALGGCWGVAHLWIQGRYWGPW